MAGGMMICYQVRSGGFGGGAKCMSRYAHVMTGWSAKEVEEVYIVVEVEEQNIEHGIMKWSHGG